MPEPVETIIVGGGQAGLAISHQLAERGREHVIFERGRVAERWRSERWDSLAFQFPNLMLRLPDIRTRAMSRMPSWDTKAWCDLSATTLHGTLLLSDAE